MMSDELTVTEAIEFAIATEETGARTYSKLAERFSAEEEISATFSLLAKDERTHQAQFQALLDRVPPDEGVMTKDEKSRYLRAMAMSEFFRGDSGLVAKLDKVDNLNEVLIHVLEFEKATLGYYLAVKDVLGETGALDKIIQAEKSHIVRLMKYILTDERMKGLADVF
jgi:rubrerythrin